MGLLIVFAVVIVAVIVIFTRNSKLCDSPSQQQQVLKSESYNSATHQMPRYEQKRLSDAEEEAIRQADKVFDWKTHNAIVDGTYNGLLPSYDGYSWSNIYPNVYHTKIAGVNYCKGIRNLAGVYFDVKLVLEPRNMYDPNAIKIVHAEDRRKIGYIHADETDSVRDFIQNDFSCYCRAHLDEEEYWDSETERDRTYLYGCINIHRPNVFQSKK